MASRYQECYAINNSLIRHQCHKQHDSLDINQAPIQMLCLTEAYEESEMDLIHSWLYFMIPGVTLKTNAKARRVFETAFISFETRSDLVCFGLAWLALIQVFFARVFDRFSLDYLDFGAFCKFLCF